MEKIEMVEKLQEKANVSLEEAKSVLENCDWDLLEAMIRLEKEGRVKVSGACGSSVGDESAHAEIVYSENSSTSRKERFESGRKRFASLLRDLFKKGMDNRFVVRRYDSVILDIPVLIAITLMIVFFWLTFILLVVGLFTHCEYSFIGADLGKDSINNGIRKAADAAQNLADQVTGRQQNQQ